MGMVLGGLPSLIQEANQRGFKARYLAALLAGGLLIGGTVFLQHHLTGGQKLLFSERAILRQAIEERTGAPAPV